MKRYWYILTVILFLIISIILYIYSPFRSTNNVSISFQDLCAKVDSIETYHVILKTKIYPPSGYDRDKSVFVNDKSKMLPVVNTTVYGESGSKMKIMTTLKQHGFEIDIILLFDGVWLWIEQKRNKLLGDQSDIIPKFEVLKIRINKVSPDPIAEPFNAGYGIIGVGLSKNKDFPETLLEILNSYNLILNKSNRFSSDVTFTGMLDDSTVNDIYNRIFKNNLESNNELNKYISQSIQFCKIWVSPTSSLIKSYLIGMSESKPTQFTEIEYISVNKELPEDIFVYTPPEGINAKDITDLIIKNSSMKSSNKGIKSD